MEKKLEKWMPIIDCLNVQDEPKRLIMANYAEQYAAKLYTINDSVSSLPIALKILSKLNLENKNVMINFEDKPSHLLFQTMKFYSDIIDNSISTTENILIHKCIDFINNELKDNNNLYIADLVQSIIVTDTLPMKMVLTTRITFD